jgi:hypothetical protein
MGDDRGAQPVQRACNRIDLDAVGARHVENGTQRSIFARM